jgi:curved DNA-binding protein CbpA
VRADQRAAAEDLSKDLNEAYRVLSNPVQRLAYDKTIRQQEIQDQVMQRYVGGFAGTAGGGVDPYASKLKRPPTLEEKRDQQRSERSALVSLFSIFLVITLGVIGLILLGGLASFLLRQFV